jgi:hypothetical protein
MLAAGHAAAADEGIAEAYRELRVATLFHSGRAADAWSTVEPLAPSRAQVLELCLYGGDVQALDEVVRLWTAAEPSSVDLARWRAHRDFLIGDYARCAESIVARGLLGELDEPIALRLEGDLVRASLRLGRFDDAMAHARRSTERDGDPYYEILVMAARGDVRATCTALERAIDRGYESTVFYGDEDLGPLLLGDAYASFRERYPLDSWAGAFAPPAPRHGEG